MPGTRALGALGGRFGAGLARLQGPLGAPPTNASEWYKNTFVFKRPNGPNGCFSAPQVEDL